MAPRLTREIYIYAYAYTGAHSAGMAALVEGISPTHWLSPQVVFTAREPQGRQSVVVIDLNAAMKDWKVGRIVRT